MSKLKLSSQFPWDSSSLVLSGSGSLYPLLLSFCCRRYNFCLIRIYFWTWFMIPFPAAAVEWQCHICVIMYWLHDYIPKKGVYNIVIILLFEYIIFSAHFLPFLVSWVLLDYHKLRNIPILYSFIQNVTKNIKMLYKEICKCYTNATYCIFYTCNITRFHEYSELLSEVFIVACYIYKIVGSIQCIQCSMQ